MLALGMNDYNSEYEGEFGEGGLKSNENYLNQFDSNRNQSDCIENFDEFIENSELSKS